MVFLGRGIELLKKTCTRDIIVTTKSMEHFCGKHLLLCRGGELRILPHSEDRQTVNRTGQILSRVKWIGLYVTINPKTVFDGGVFEHGNRFSKVEIQSGFRDPIGTKSFDGRDRRKFLIF